MSSFRERKERGSEPVINKDDEEARESRPLHGVVLRRLSSFQLPGGDPPKQRAPAQPLTNGTAPKVKGKEYCLK
jgi:hypothetical protein